MNLNYVVVTGYGSSGGTAVRDLLNEVDTYWLLKTEFRLIKDPYGILDLERILIDRYSDLNDDNAIKDFLWNAEHLYQKKGKFYKAGLDYYHSIGPHFMEATHDYIDSLVEFEYTGYWHLFNFKSGYFSLLFKKLEKRLGIDYANKGKMYFTDLTKEKLYESTKRYMDQLFTPMAEESHSNTIVLHNATDPTNYFLASRYFNQVKTIIVERDIRDVFINMMKVNNQIGRDICKSHDIDKFIMWQRKTRRIPTVNQDDTMVLRIKFEDLIEQYDLTVSKIFEFLNLDSKYHTQKYKYFNPNKSKVNVGLWRNSEFSDEIEKIHENMSEYCYQE